MKKLISLLLAVLMVCSTGISAFAINAIPSASATEIEAGETVAIDVTVDEAYSNLTGLEARLYFDTELFTWAVTSKKSGVTVNKEVKTDSIGNYLQIGLISLDPDGVSVDVGESLANITFTAKEDISAKTEAKFVARIAKGGLVTGEKIPESEIKEITVTVTPVACEHTETETAYTPKGNGKHTVTVTCKKCGEVISTADEDCTKGEDGKCIHCGYVFPVSGDEYTVTVKVVPNTVDVTFYSGENAETELPKNKVEYVGIDGNYNVYKLTVPKGIYSYRATDSEDDVYLGGMSFEVPVSTEVDAAGNPMITDQSITLVRNNFYTTNKKVSAVGDYSIDIYPAGRAAVVNGTQYKNDNGYVVTPAMLQAHGNALLYNYRITLNGELGNNYGVPFVSNYTITSTVSATQNRTFFLNELTAYSITAPAGATVKYFRQINNFNVEEIPVSETVTNNDGTVTYKVKVTGPNYTYRVSMEGKLTKAGYLSAQQKEFVITFGEDENPKSTKNVMENTEMAKRIESSTLVNVNAKNELSLGVGETFRLRSYRAAWQIINSDTDNIMIEPDFNYKVISGGEHIRMTPVSDRCTGNAGTGEHSNWMDIKGVSAGVAILEVSYDAIEIGASARGQGGNAATRYTGTYGATDPKRTALVVINVGGAESELSMTAKDADHEWDAEFDTVYTFENTATLNFTATLGGDAPAVQLSTDKGESWKSVSVNGDGSFTATGLSEGNNILKFTANGKTAYQVVRAAKLTYTVTNLTTKDASEIYVGDTARIVFSGLYQPMPKISGIYNPGYGNPTGNQIIYNIPEGAKQGGRSGQYSFVGTNKYDITINEEGKFVLTGGYIDFGVMAHENPAGEHRTIPDGGVGTNFNATKTMFKYCVMPDLTIEVKAKQEHSWGEPTYVWSSDNGTCTATRSCALHDNETETETANSEYSVVRVATCEEKGEGKYTAEFKNSAFTKQKKTVDIPALGHKLVHHDAKAATCAAEGNIEYWECSVCKKQFADSKGEVLVNTVVIKKNPNNHTGGTELKNDKAATCGEEGYTGDRCCKGCGAVLEKGKTIPKTPHSWKTPAYVWSEDNKTVTAKRVCANDSNHTEAETANCSYKELRAATCEEKGEGKYTAEFKNSAFTKQEKTVDIPALGHKLVRHDAKAATCIAEGNIEYWECSVCKKLFSDKDGKTEVKTVATEKNPNNHTGETEVKNYVEATCTKSGYTGDTYCKSCEKLISAGKASPVVPHKFGAWVITKAPTTLSNGTKVRSCTVCGYEESAIIPRLTDNDDVIHIGIGEKNEEKNPETGAQAPSGLAAAVLIAAAVLMSTKKRK